MSLSEHSKSHSQWSIPGWGCLEKKKGKGKKSYGRNEQSRGMGGAV
jgi:hypothetical protein